MSELATSQPQVEPADDTAAPQPPKYLAGLLAAAGLFLVITGPALSLLTLAISAAGDQAPPPSGADPLSAMHVVGLLAGLTGGVLLLVGVAWWVSLVVRERRHRS